MDKTDKEIKILKGVVKAQAKMILAYKIGPNHLPESVFKALDRATKFYKVDSVSDIK